MSIPAAWEHSVGGGANVVFRTATSGGDAGNPRVMVAEPPAVQGTAISRCSSSARAVPEPSGLTGGYCSVDEQDRIEECLLKHKTVQLVELAKEVGLTYDQVKSHLLHCEAHMTPGKLPGMMLGNLTYVSFLPREGNCLLDFMRRDGINTNGADRRGQREGRGEGWDDQERVEEFVGEKIGSEFSKEYLEHIAREREERGRRGELQAALSPRDAKSSVNHQTSATQDPAGRTSGEIPGGCDLGNAVAAQGMGYTRSESGTLSDEKAEGGTAAGLASAHRLRDSRAG